MQPHVRFINHIEEQLTHAQAIAKRIISEKGFDSDVSLSPTVRISYGLLKKETGRQRLRDAFFNVVVAEITKRGLFVHSYDHYMVITKPYVDHAREFETLDRLYSHNVKHLAE